MIRNSSSVGKCRSFSAEIETSFTVIYRWTSGHLWWRWRSHDCDEVHCPYYKLIAANWLILLAVHFSLDGFIIDLFLLRFASLHRILFAPLNRHLCIPKLWHVLPNCRLCTRAFHFSKPRHYYACCMGILILSDHLLSPIVHPLRGTRFSFVTRNELMPKFKFNVKVDDGQFDRIAARASTQCRRDETLSYTKRVFFPNAKNVLMNQPNRAIGVANLTDSRETELFIQLRMSAYYW